jgi:hypothetical protein
MRARVALLALLLAACSSLPGPHWRGAGERLVVVRVAPAVVSAEFMAGIQWGAGIWSFQSPYIWFDVGVGTCPGDIYCVQVDRAAINGEVTYVGNDSAGHMYGTAVHMFFDSGPWDLQVLAHAACHGFGHAAGLEHGTTTGPCVDGWPTQTDLDNLAAMYAHND